MADQWFYNKSGTKKGPYTIEQMRTFAESKQIKRDTQVWHAGLTGWTPANNTELEPAFSDLMHEPPATPETIAANEMAAKVGIFVVAFVVIYAFIHFWSVLVG